MFAFSMPFGWISIHALRVEGDLFEVNALLPHFISIHALRVEGDIGGAVQLRHGVDFYPRPPGGGRLLYYVQSGAYSQFLSTPSGWRATEIFGVRVR